MTSVAMSLAVARARRTRMPLRLYETPELLLRAAAAHDAPMEVPAGVHRFARVATQRVGTGTVHTLTPRRGARPRRTVFYVHGGGFLFPPDAGHWRILRALIRDTGATVILPRYRLAPAGTYQEAIEFLRHAVGALLDPRDSWLLAGDSAGGGLAFALARTLRDDPIPGRTPQSVMLLSPWLDLQLEAWVASADRGAVRDPILAPAGLLAAGALFAGNADERERLRWQPADCGGLPPIEIHHGTRDLLIFGSRSLRDAAAAVPGANGVILREYPGCIHGFPTVRGSSEALAVRVAVARAVTAR